jgi:hypothetical protein
VLDRTSFFHSVRHAVEVKVVGHESDDIDGNGNEGNVPVARKTPPQLTSDLQIQRQRLD